ncbi:MAG: hypothetical protein EP341_05385 [Sphingomonadales bacterium]|nr:MAG: hypothetical protein EP341_05385 [Sphingomonadales bacterium]
MTEQKNAPERIWTAAQPAPSSAFVSYKDKPKPIDGFTEYIRADIHASAIRQVRNDALREAAHEAKAHYIDAGISAHREYNAGQVIASAILAMIDKDG